MNMGGHTMSKKRGIEFMHQWLDWLRRRAYISGHMLVRIQPGVPKQHGERSGVSGFDLHSDRRQGSIPWFSTKLLDNSVIRCYNTK